VVGVFYGHPGVFVSPSHRTIAIARDEGYIATMLPGVSAEDCLYADLDIDPSSSGCVTYEATDLLLSNRTLVPSSHLILYQVGVVGITDFNFKGFKNNNFHFLLDRLEAAYGSDHPVVHYIAAVLPLDEPIMEKYTIAELRDPQTQNTINAVSTFYLPPKTVPKYDRESAVKMGILEPGQDIMRPSYPSSRWLEPEISAREAYGVHENAAIAKIESHVPPSFYRPLSASTAMKEVMIKLALDPKALADYKRDPALFSDSISGLTPWERTALRDAHASRIISSMKDNTEGVFVPPIFLLVVIIDIAGHLGVNDTTADATICE